MKEQDPDPNPNPDPLVSGTDPQIRDTGCLFRFPDPYFFPIPDPGSTTLATNTST